MNAYAMLMQDTQAWDFGCFYWVGDDLRCDENAAKNYLQLKRQVETTKQVLLPPKVTANV